MVKEFIALDKRKALRLALSYWYKNLTGEKTLAEFISCCTWKKVGIDYIITYYDQSVAKRELWQ